MRIGFVVNNMTTETKDYATARLGLVATNQGHEVWVMGLGALE